MPLKTVRYSGSELEVWEAAAAAAGLKLNAWIRRALNETAALERAAMKEDR